MDAGIVTARKPVVAHILPWQGVGGTEYATLRVAQAVADQYSSVFFCPAEAPEVAAFFEGAGQTTVLYPRIEPAYRRPWHYILASWQLAKQLRRNQVQLVHCADWTAVQYAALAARLASCRLISHVRNRTEVIPRRDWWVLRSVARFVFVSQHTAAVFGYPAPLDRTTVLYDGITDPSEAAMADELYDRFNLPHASRVVGMAARVGEQKDFPTLIAAAAILKSRYPDLRFIIFGDFERHLAHRVHYRLVRDCLAYHGVEGMFHFAGYCENVPRLLGGLEIFVLSTHWEGLPLVILEAMAQGLPVVATAVDGIPEAVEDNVTGHLVPHADASALAQALDTLLSDRALAHRMGQAGRQRVLGEFSVEQYSANLHQLYGSILG